LKAGARVFRERRSLIFKSLRVVRFCDATHNTLVYLVYSERLVEGSPKNSVAAVPIRPWPGQEGELAHCLYKD
jgi:CreA protein